MPKYTDYEAIESKRGLNDVLDSVLLVDEEVFLDDLMQFVKDPYRIDFNEVP
jgi:hypothetical protein